ncbi:unnamed protein product, partial [marine sediment metagenome]
MSHLHDMNLKDKVTGKYATVATNGAQDVNISDQHSRTGDVYFSQIVGVPSTLLVAGAIDSYTITMSPGHGIVAGDQLVVFDSVSGRV